MSTPFRILCALLTLLVALPAFQASACAPLPVIESGVLHGGGHENHGGDDVNTHHKPQPAHQTVQHDCIGCVPPIDTRPIRVISRAQFDETRTIWPNIPASLISWLGAPDPPPPRSSV